VRLRERGSTHPHGDLAQSLIDSSGLVLDFGGGAQAGERLRRNVINLDAIQFPGVDVVCTHPRLPLRAGSFDAVVSQAAFQHLRDPGGAVREILRVLKPGGRLLIDTAFMQPDHGDPERYFNMTCRGLLSLLDGFVVEQAGVQPYQTPSNGLIMQLNSVIPLMRSGRWHDQLVRLLADLRADGAALDRDLGAIGRETLAAGVFVLARKP
jgi:SAM-dependent methyltransferase